MMKDTIIKVVSKLPHYFRQSTPRTGCVLPFYHAVSDAPLPHIQALYPLKNTTAFEKDLDYLLAHYHPISFADFENFEAQQVSPGRPTFLLSFDDGLRECYDVIAPILLRKGVPAIFFLNSAFLDNQALFYRYKVSALIGFLTEHPSKQAVVAQFLHKKGDYKTQLLACRYADTAALAELAAHIGFDSADFLRKQQPYLTTAQVQTLLAQGFAIGAHSIDHPHYYELPLQEQLRQTIESVQFIQANFNTSYSAFSFPFTDFGVSRTFFHQLHTVMPTITTFGCAGIKADTTPRHFQRVAMERGTLTAQQILAGEYLYAKLTVPFGKNHIHRHD